MRKYTFRVKFVEIGFNALDAMDISDRHILRTFSEDHFLGS